MSVRIAPVEPIGALHSGLTNQEVLNAVHHAYPRLGGALGVAMYRFQLLLDTVNGNVPFPAFEPEKVNCPHCGSALIITDQQGTPPNGS